MILQKRALKLKPRQMELMTASASDAMICVSRSRLFRRLRSNAGLMNEYISLATIHATRATYKVHIAMLCLHYYIAIQLKKL